MGVGERVEHLRADLDGVAIGERSCANRVPHRASRDVLVRDVDVPGVVPDVVCAHAAVVTEPARRQRLALGARGGLALARDDLQRDVQAVLLVECEPDRAGAAAAERAHRPVAPENELLGGGNDRDRGHRCTLCRRSAESLQALNTPTKRLEWHRGA